MRWRLKTVVAACLTASLLAQAGLATAQERVSVSDGRQLAGQLYRSGQYRAVRELALALLQADPNDVAIMVLLARAEQALGNQDDARDVARRAWQGASTEDEKFATALTVAEIAANRDQLTKAQIWLRRASNHAPNPAAEAFVARAFDQVRRANPLSIRFDFGVAPSDNVNSGTSNDTVRFAYLPGVFSTLDWLVPPDERPLSGVEVSLQSDLRYRLSETQRSRTSLEAGFYARSYIMSEEARDAAPEVTGQSLSYGQIYVGIGHQWVPEAIETPLSASVRYAIETDANGIAAQKLSADFGAQFTLSETDQFSVGAGLERARFQDETFATRSTLRTQWTRAFENEDRFFMSTQIERSVSDAIDRDYSSATLSLGYDFGEIFENVDLSTTFEQHWKSYETVSLDPNGREDVRRSVQVSVGFSAIEVYGFEPVVTLRHQVTDSTVPSYDSAATTMGLNLRSSF